MTSTRTAKSNTRLIGLAQQNNNFASVSRFLVHFVEVTERFVISNFVKVVITKQRLSLSFSKLGYGTDLFTYFNSKTFTNIWQIEGGGIKAIQVETTQTHFLGKVFTTAAAIVIA